MEWYSNEHKFLDRWVCAKSINPVQSAQIRMLLLQFTLLLKVNFHPKRTHQVVECSQTLVIVLSIANSNALANITRRLIGQHQKFT